MSYLIQDSRRRGLVLLLLCLFSRPVGSSDCNGNGVADSLDLSRGISTDCNGNSSPDECDILPVNVSLKRRWIPELTRPGQWLASADMDGDGWPDIVAVDRSSVVVRVLVNQQVNPPFSDLTARQYAIDDEPRGAVVHDLDGDGDLDVAVTEKYIGQVTVLLNHGGGALLSAARLTTSGWAVAIAAADWDGDGNADLAVVNSGMPDLVVYPGLGPGAYGTRRLVRLTDASLGENAPGCLDAADANDDARVDLSDGIAILSDFFVPEDSRLPAPGPFVCGVDLTKDALACNQYDLCDAP